LRQDNDLAAALQRQRSYHRELDHLVCDEDQAGEHDALKAEFGVGVHGCALNEILVMLNLFQHNALLSRVILKRVQDDDK
jgi:hypothetical protein